MSAKEGAVINRSSKHRGERGSIRTLRGHAERMIIRTLGATSDRERKKIPLRVAKVNNSRSAFGT
jgi:hypothetical protein